MKLRLLWREISRPIRFQAPVGR